MVNIWTFFSQVIGTRCPLCRAPADGLCDACSAALPRNDHACPRCALPMPASAPIEIPCAGCLVRPTVFERALAPLVYLPPVDDLIAGFKYHRRLAFGRIIGDVLADAAAGISDPPGLLLPVPMHPARLRRRGANHAQELAHRVSRRTGIPQDPNALARLQDGVHQRGLSRRERLRNIRKAFGVRKALPDHVALIDDVITTGATAEAIALALRSAGVGRVEVWAVARTPHDR